MKKRSIISMLTIGACMLSLAACAPATSETTTAAADTTTAASETTTVADSSAADTTVATGDLSGNIALNGSTSMEKVAGVLSEQFMLDNPGVTISYDATGSGTGIEAVKNGVADIGLSSRTLKDEEISAGLKPTTIALDGIAVIVNAESTITDLKLEDIKDIYTGEKTNWSDFGGESLEISTVGREAGSGTRDGFESITDTEDKAVLAQELTSTGAVIEAVKSSKNAIGYASFVSVEGKEGIKILSVDGVVCSEESISDGSYTIQRPFNLVTKEGATLSPQAKAFFDYMTSKEASELIASAGTVPAIK